MRAAVLTAYGPPTSVVLTDLPLPEPGPGQVRVRVHATTVNMGDAEIRSMSMPWLFAVPIRIWLGVLRPRPGCVLGMELAGVVDALGEGVSQPAVGERVFGAPDLGFGTHAEAVCVDASALMPIPRGVTFAQAATLPIAGLEAVGYLRKAGVDGPKRLLIRGASGSIGSFALQLAKRMGAQVTAVCGAAGVERMRQLGADVVHDFQVHDFDADDSRYDAMIDIVGKTPLRRCLAVVEPGGTLVRVTVPGVLEVLGALVARLFTGKRVRIGEGGGTREDLRRLVGWVADGTLQTVIDRRYPLERIADAHAYVQTGHKQGHVVIEIDQPAMPNPGSSEG